MRSIKGETEDFDRWELREADGQPIRGVRAFDVGEAWVEVVDLPAMRTAVEAIDGEASERRRRKVVPQEVELVTRRIYRDFTVWDTLNDVLHAEARR